MGASRAATQGLLHKTRCAGFEHRRDPRCRSQRASGQGQRILLISITVIVVRPPCKGLYVL